MNSNTDDDFTTNHKIKANRRKSLQQQKKQIDNISIASNASSSSNTSIKNDNDKKQRRRTFNIIFKPTTTTTTSTTSLQSSSSSSTSTSPASKTISLNDKKTRSSATIDTEMTKNEIDEIKKLWKVGTLVEARDLHDNWYQSRIIELDKINNRVKIHFVGWNSRYDQCYDLFSNDVRPLKGSDVSVLLKEKSSTESDESTEKNFKAGEKILAKWTDNFYYPCTVIRSLIKNGALYYEVRFEDGVKKFIRFSNCKPFEQTNDVALPEIKIDKTVVEVKKEEKVVEQLVSSESSVTLIESQQNEQQSTQQSSVPSAPEILETPKIEVQTQVSDDNATTNETASNNNVNIRKSTRIKRQRTFSNDEIPLLVRRQSVGNNKKRKMNEDVSTNLPLVVNSQESINSKPANVVENTPAPNIASEISSQPNISSSPQTSLETTPRSKTIDFYKTLSLFKSNNRKRNKTINSTEPIQIEPQLHDLEQTISDQVPESQQIKATEDTIIKSLSTQQSNEIKFQVNLNNDQNNSSIKLKISKFVASKSEPNDTTTINTPKLESQPQPIQQTKLLQHQISAPPTELIRCKFSNCNKTFRKQHLLDYHIKYHHYEDGRIIEVVTKKRKLTQSEEDHNTDNASKKVKIDEQKEKPKKAEENENEEEGDPYEVIRCKCDKTISVGFMIQCDICLCWQHGDCINISSENAPKNYICWVCSKYQNNNTLNLDLNKTDNKNSNSELNKLLNDCTEHYTQLNLLIYNIDCRVSSLKKMKETENEYNESLLSCEKLQDLFGDHIEKLNLKLEKLEKKYGLDGKSIFKNEDNKLDSYIERFNNVIDA